MITPPLDFPGESAPLSARERTVARLAAQGLTDKEIAGQLVIPPRTVSNTPYRIHQKIGATDRRHLRRRLSA
ncbi:helix-turn-helix domain-containing protein [Streptomyces cucumeris]|uniref:helix-turn-helix domain-containing protein n=1 Tax=Streptomyces cucumeris TaxID=2962890 RepID=UPI003D707D10